MLRPVQFVPAIGLLILLVGQPLAAQSPPGPCLDLKPIPRPNWVFSGAWGDDSLLLLDVVPRAIIKYPLQTNSKGKVVLGNAEPDTVEGSLPSLFQGLAGGFLLQESDGSFKRLSEGFGHYTKAVSLIGARGSDGSVLQSVDSWVADASGSHLLLYGDIQDSAGEWYSGFATASLESPRKFSLVQRIKLDGSARRFYINSQSYMAVIDGEGYFLDMDGYPSIKRVSLDGLSPLARPVGYAEKPALPDRLTQPLRLHAHGGFDAVKEAFAELQRLQGPLGLVAHGRLLYVLARDGGHWTLEVVDPIGGHLRTLYLPSFSPHLMVIPGRPYFALLEKSEVDGLGVQPIHNILLVPTSWFTSSDSPLRDKTTALGACEGR